MAGIAPPRGTPDRCDARMAAPKHRTARASRRLNLGADRPAPSPEKAKVLVAPRFFTHPGSTSPVDLYWPWAEQFARMASSSGASARPWRAAGAAAAVTSAPAPSAVPMLPREAPSEPSTPPTVPASPAAAAAAAVPATPVFQLTDPHARRMHQFSDYVSGDRVDARLVIDFVNLDPSVVDAGDQRVMRYMTNGGVPVKYAGFNRLGSPGRPGPSVLSVHLAPEPDAQLEASDALAWDLMDEYRQGGHGTPDGMKFADPVHINDASVNDLEANLAAAEGYMPGDVPDMAVRFRVVARQTSEITGETRTYEGQVDVRLADVQVVHLSSGESWGDTDRSVPIHGAAHARGRPVRVYYETNRITAVYFFDALQRGQIASLRLVQ